MSNASEREVEEALRKYMRAFDEYRERLDRYFPVRPVVPGEPLVYGEPITEAALRELEEAEAEVTETRRKWMEALRRSKGV